MASRFAQNKPDPAIKKNVRQARARQQSGKYARAIVAGASVAVTIMGWALFSTGEANMLAQAQDTQYVTTIATQTQETITSLALATSATATPATVSAITSTRSSR